MATPPDIEKMIRRASAFSLNKALNDPYREFHKQKEEDAWALVNLDIQNSFYTFSEAFRPPPNGGPRPDGVSVTAHGSNITGNVERNVITGGTVTSYVIEWSGPDGVASLTISGFAPQNAKTFFNKMTSIVDSYEYAVGLLKGNTVARVADKTLTPAVFDTGAGDDRVTGGAGDDDALKWKQGDLFFNGKGGSDTLQFASLEGAIPNALRGAIVDLTVGTGRNPFGGTLTLRNVENASGTDLADKLTGSSADNELSGGAGADTILGLGGDDFIALQPDFSGGGSNNILADGGAGQDSLSIGAYEYLSLSRLDILDQSRNTGVFKGGQFLNFEEVVALSNSLVQARFEILGGNGGELLRTSVAADTVNGRGGNDTIYGLGGGDKLFGGSGSDTLFFQSAVTVNLATSKASRGEAEGTTFSGFENITSNSGGNVFTGSAAGNRLEGYGFDTINGGGGNDTIVSGFGDNRLSGGTGNDRIEASGGTIDGGAGNDIIVLDGFSADRILGGAGADRITGWFGEDTMSGGAGSDRFIFATSFETGATRALADRILDFRHGQDDIDLSAIDAKAGVNGNQAFIFKGGAAFNGEGQVRVAHANGDTFVEINVFGRTGAEAIIKLEGNIGLTAGDFVL